MSQPSVRHCPRCGQANQCAQATPQTSAEPCWCFSVQIAAAALAALPEAQRGVACLCPRCAQVHAESQAPAQP